MYSHVKWQLIGWYAFAAGYRNYNNAALNNVGSNGNYWSSTVSGTNARNLNFNSGNANFNTNNRANGFSVRCLKETMKLPILPLKRGREVIKKR